MNRTQHNTVVAAGAQDTPLTFRVSATENQRIRIVAVDIDYDTDGGATPTQVMLTINRSGIDVWKGFAPRTAGGSQFRICFAIGNSCPVQHADGTLVLDGFHAAGQSSLPDVWWTGDLILTLGLGDETATDFLFTQARLSYEQDN